MIRYTLKCLQAHEFDSWFQSAAAFDGLLAAGRLSCPVCGAAEVEKSLMAPAVRPARSVGPESAPVPSLQAPLGEAEAALAALRRHIEETSDYVGVNFVTEARAIHDGDAPQRPIHGEARADEARKLIEDGVQVALLPFLPPRKVN